VDGNLNDDNLPREGRSAIINLKLTAVNRPAINYPENSDPFSLKDFLL
jgi:hypothetical protein